jgi:hypothetical protein
MALDSGFQAGMTNKGVDRYGLFWAYSGPILGTVYLCVFAGPATRGAERRRRRNTAGAVLRVRNLAALFVVERPGAPALRRAVRRSSGAESRG